MKIKRFKLRDGVTRDELIAAGFREGGSWVVSKDKANADLYKCYYFECAPLDFEYSISIAFYKDISEWNDFDNILVLDEEYGQPYTPFYDDKYYGKDVNSQFKALNAVIKSYNDVLSSLPFLIEVTA